MISPLTENPIAVDALQGWSPYLRSEPGQAPVKLQTNALVLITQGQGYCYIDERIYLCKPDSLLVLAAYQTLRFAEGYTGEGVVISFSEDGMFAKEYLDANHALVLAMRGIDIVYDVDSLVRYSFSAMYEEGAQQDTASLVIQTHILRTVLYKVLLRTDYQEQDGARDSDLVIFRRFIDALEQGFIHKRCVSDYSVLLKLTSRKLNSACLRVKQRSAKQLIDNRIVSEIKRMLLHTSLSVASIAAELGFNEPTNLSKFFRKHTGVTPSEFRSAARVF